MFSLWGGNLLGIDIGSHSIKAVKLRGKRGSYTLEKAAWTRIPEAEGERSIGSVLLGFLKNHKIKDRTVASVISGQSVTVRHLYLPHMPERDLKEAVKWELRREMSFPSNELIVDYVVTGGGGENKLSLMVFATRKGDVNEIVKVFKEASIDLMVLDAVPTAMLSAFDINNTWEKGVNYAMLDLGASGTTLAIFKDRCLGFVREISFSGNGLTQSIMDALSLPHDDAEGLKISCGVSSTDEERGRKVREILLPLIDGLVTELHRSFDYYQAQFRQGGISRVFLSGGTARLKGLDTLLSELLGIQCFVDDPFRGVRLPGHIDTRALGSVAPYLTIATGLATRKVAL